MERKDGRCRCEPQPAKEVQGTRREGIRLVFRDCPSSGRHRCLTSDGLHADTAKRMLDDVRSTQYSKTKELIQDGCTKKFWDTPPWTTPAECKRSTAVATCLAVFLARSARSRLLPNTLPGHSSIEDKLGPAMGEIRQRWVPFRPLWKK